MKQAIKQYRDLGLEVYINEIDYGDADPAAAATSAHRTTAFDNLQGTNLHEFAQAAASAGVSWLCLWGIADNSNQYWRMGQSALLFDESYNAKDSYYQFRQGIVDGLATPTTIRITPSVDNKEHAYVQNGIIYMEGQQNGMVALMDAFGAVQARIPLIAGKGLLPKLSQGSYVWRLENNHTSSGMLLVK